MVVYRIERTDRGKYGMYVRHDGKTFRVKSESLKNREYHVFWSSIYRRWACDCPAWHNRDRKANTNCKHIKAVLKFLDETPTDQLRREGREVDL